MQGEMSGSEKKVNDNTYDISPRKSVTKKFLEVTRCSRAKQRVRNVPNKMLWERIFGSGCTTRM